MLKRVSFWVLYAIIWISATSVTFTMAYFISHGFAGSDFRGVAHPTLAEAAIMVLVSFDWATKAWKYWVQPKLDSKP